MSGGSEKKKKKKNRPTKDDKDDPLYDLLEELAPRVEGGGVDLGPISDATDVIFDAGREVAEGVENLIDPKVPKAPKQKTPKPKPPSRADTVGLSIQQQLDEIERRRRNKSLTTSGQGVSDTPLASTTLFGV